MTAPFPRGARAFLAYAAPTVASCLCNSAFRVNDQFWVGALGKDAQAALGAATFVMVLNYALYFLAVAGSVSKVARATGARDAKGQGRAIQHGLALSTAIAVLVGFAGYRLAPLLIATMGLEGGVAQAALEYIRTMYALALPLALAPLIDNIFIALGDTRTPLKLQVLAIVSNFVMNPLLIYGGLPGEPVEVWLGVPGAALATGASRALAVLVGLVVLARREHIPLWPRYQIHLRELLHTMRTGLPSSASISIYAFVYLALTKRVFAELPKEALAGFGIGFNAFEAVSYPSFLGLALAGGGLVGRALGAGDHELAWQQVRLTRRVAVGFGLLSVLAFWGLGPILIPAFTREADVQAAALIYVQILAFSQPFVALETSSENVLVGSGYTRPIFWITVPGNLARVPLGIWMALRMGWGAPGLWWAINLTSMVKALVMFALVQRGRWSVHSDHGHRSDP
ncbi:MAG: MATE family efflux transporter [Planctomycetota bacterium]